MRGAHEWAPSQEQTIQDADPVSNYAGPTADPEEAGRQLYAVPAQLCEGQALGVMHNTTNGNRLESVKSADETP